MLKFQRLLRKRQKTLGGYFFLPNPAEVLKHTLAVLFSSVHEVSNKKIWLSSLQFNYVALYALI